MSGVSSYPESVAQEIQTVFTLDGKMVRLIYCASLSLLLQGCTEPSVHETVTLTLLEEWSNKRFSEARQQELEQFTPETGIQG